MSGYIDVAKYKFAQCKAIVFEWSNIYYNYLLARPLVVHIDISVSVAYILSAVVIIKKFL